MKTKLNLLVLAAFMFAGCEKEEFPLKSNIITAKVEKGKDYQSEFSSVKVLLYRYSYVGIHYVTTENDSYEAASSSYIDGGFSLTLPETVDYNSLMPLANLFWYGSGVSVSNSSARGFEIEIKGYDKNGVFVDNFEYKSSKGNVKGRFIYVDRDVTITNADGLNMYNLNLKKGWNMYYYRNYGYGYKSGISSKTDFKEFKWYRSKDL